MQYQQNSKTRSQIITIDTMDQLKEKLLELENIIAIEEVDKKSQINLFQNYKKELSLFFKQLDMMMQSNLNFNEALELIAQTNTNKFIAELIRLIQNGISRNDPIDEVLQKYQKQIGVIPIVFLKLGLEHGTIKQAIHSITILLEKEITLKKDLLEKLRYPLFLLLCVIGTFLLIFIYVVPNFEFIFRSLGDNLPTSTQALLFTKELLTNYYYWIIGIVLFCGIVGFIIKKSFSQIIDKFVIQYIPYISKIIFEYQMYKLFLSLSMLVASKYQFQTAIVNCIDATTNSYIKTILSQINQGIKNGEDIATMFSKYSFCDSLVIKLLYTAQNTAQYEVVLYDITNYYLESFENNLKKAIAFIEPFMILLIGIIVLWIILAVMVPIWQLGAVGL